MEIMTISRTDGPPGKGSLNCAHISHGLRLALLRRYALACPSLSVCVHCVSERVYAADGRQVSESL